MSVGQVSSRARGIWVVEHTPYPIVYRISGQDLEVVRIWHGRRDWMNRDD